MRALAAQEALKAVTLARSGSAVELCVSWIGSGGNVCRFSRLTSGARDVGHTENGQLAALGGVER